MHRYLTTEEAAEYCRARNGSSIRAWIARGELRPDGRVGTRGSYLFLRDTLDTFLKGNLS